VRRVKVEIVVESRGRLFLLSGTSRCGDSRAGERWECVLTFVCQMEAIKQLKELYDEGLMSKEVRGSQRGRDFVLAEGEEKRREKKR
jgi:hypothetical protein